MAEILGVELTVDILLPNLIEAYLSVNVEDEDKYEKYAELLVLNLGRVISVLGQAQGKAEQIESQWKIQAGEGIIYEGESGDQAVRKKVGYDALLLLFTRVFSHFFSSSAFDRAMKD